MKNIFFAFTAGLGPVMRTGEILRRFSDENLYNIYYSCPHGKDILIKYCKKYINIDYCLTSKESVKKHGRWVDEDHHAAMVGYLDQNMLEHNISLFLEVMEKYNIDLCISDLCVEANIACKILAIPYISVTQGCYHPNARGNRVRWWESKKKNTPKVYPLINELLNKYGIPSINSIVDLFVGEITIIPNYQSFDALANTQGIIFTGPIFLDHVTNFDNELDSQINSFSGDYKRIFSVYPGRLVDSSGYCGKKIVETFLECMDKFTDIGFIFFSGGMWTKDDLNKKQLPNNIKIISSYVPPYIPNSYGDILINHGGHGSCMMALKYGKPSLIIPTHSEREYNARAMERLEVSRMLAINNLTPKSLQENLQELLCNKSYRANSLAWKNKIEKDDERINKFIEMIKRNI